MLVKIRRLDRLNNSYYGNPNYERKPVWVDIQFTKAGRINFVNEVGEK